MKKIKYLLVLILVVAAGLLYYHYDANKERLFFIENAQMEVNTEFDEESVIAELLDGSFEDVSCDISKLDTSKVGEYSITYTYRKLDYTTTVKVIDTTKPEISKLKTITIEEGQSIDYDKGVKVEDNSKQECQLDIDSSKVDTKKPGTYTVQYKATDPSGNSIEKERKVVVKEKVVIVPAKTIAPTGDKVVYLTFDDGPSYNTKRIIDILEKYNAKATFFVTGNGQSYNKYIKEAHDKGHTIALHTYCHDYQKIYSSTDAYFNDLDKIGSMVEKIIGYRPHYIRFPGGSSNTVSRHYSTGIMTKLSSLVTQKGYKYYDWNASTGDASGNNVPVSTIIRNSTGYKSNNIMLLAHDTGAKDTTVEALPSIIEHYQKLGYVFKGIDDSTFTPHQGINN